MKPSVQKGMKMFEMSTKVLKSKFFYQSLLIAVQDALQTTANAERELKNKRMKWLEKINRVEELEAKDKEIERLKEMVKFWEKSTESSKIAFDNVDKQLFESRKRIKELEKEVELIRAY